MDTAAETDEQLPVATGHVTKEITERVLQLTGHLK